MSLAANSRLIVNRDQDLRALPLTPQEFFLFSRVEALAGAEAPTVAEVIGASGQPRDLAEKALTRLIELGALEVETPEAGESKRMKRSALGADALRDRARSRRRGLLEAQMRVLKQVGVTETKAPKGASQAGFDEPEGASQAGFEAGFDGSEAAPLPKSKEPSATQKISPEGRSILERISPVAETDSRLVPDLAVVIERQRRLLAVRDNLRRIGHFEMLGLEPIDDEKAVRRAFHVVSREFHPDAFYGKDLGEFRTVLDDLFRRARGSYEFLLDAERRRTLVAAHEEQLRAEREQLERETLARRRAEQEAEDSERARREAEAAALRAEQERIEKEARAARDKRRQQQLRDRMFAHRRKQAREHAEQAQRELENGRHGTAATLFRLAHEHDPQGGYEPQWRETLAIARRRRAEGSFSRGQELASAGRPREAAHAFADAAEADPSLRNLAEAASAYAEVDPARAREYALLALETLQQAKAQGLTIDPQVAAGVHQACARAFLAAGQLASAKEQAERAHAIAPSKHTRTLLNSIKLP